VKNFNEFKKEMRVKADRNQKQKLKGLFDKLNKAKDVKVTYEKDGSIYINNREKDMFGMVKFASEDNPENPFVYSIEGGPDYGAADEAEVIEALRDGGVL
jgi:hypothetical protein